VGWLLYIISPHFSKYNVDDIQELMISLKKTENTILLLILGITPLLFCNQMQYNFHTPKYLFMQFAVFFAIAIILLRKHILIQINSLDSLVLFRLLWFIPLAFMTNRYASLFDNIDIFAYLALFYVVIQMIFSDRSRTGTIDFMKITVSVIAIACSIEALYGLLQYIGLDLFHPGGYQSYESLVVGTFGSANSMGGYLAASFPFLIYWFYTQKKKICKYVIGFCGLIILCALVLTLSRGAWLALLGGLFFLAYPVLHRFFKKRFQNKYIKIGIVIIISLVILISLVGIYHLNADSALGRIFIWKVSGLMIRDYPILGVGYGNYGFQYLNYQAKFFDNHENAIYYEKACGIKSAHSEFVHITAETGIIGLVLFCLLIILFFIYSRKILLSRINKESRNLVRIFVAAFIVIILHSAVDSVLHTLPISIMFYFSLAMMSALSKKYSDNMTRYSKSIGFNLKTNKLMLSIGIIILLFNIYRIVYKGIGYVHWKSGQNEVMQGNWDKGIEEYENAIKYLPNNGELQFHLGAAYSYTGQSEKALKIIQQSQDSFNDKNIYIVLGITHMDLGNYEEAEENLKNVTYMYPQLLYPHFLLAQLYHRTAYISRAVSELHYILEENPKILSDDVRAIKRDAERYLYFLQNPGN